MIFRAAAYFFIFLWSGVACADDTRDRLALVIGNAAYQRATLKNPVSDAKLMAERLRSLGFEVFPAYDASQRDMKRALQNFSATLHKRGKPVIAFIFYAGHGVQLKAENYLVPIDEHIENEGDVDLDTISLSSVMSVLSNTKLQLSVVVLDSCRDNPFAFSRSIERGLARADAPIGSLVAFSTSPGKVAFDGQGDNSYYTAALAKALTEPGLKIEDVFKSVRKSVRAQTHNEQTPWESTSLVDDFYPAGQTVSGNETLITKKSSRIAKSEQPSKPELSAAPSQETLKISDAELQKELTTISDKIAVSTRRLEQLHELSERWDSMTNQLLKAMSAVDEQNARCVSVESDSERADCSRAAKLQRERAARIMEERTRLTDAIKDSAQETQVIAISLDELRARKKALEQLAGVNLDEIKNRISNFHKEPF